MWHNCKTSESDPRGVLGHGGETYNDEPFGGSFGTNEALFMKRDLDH